MKIFLTVIISISMTILAGCATDEGSWLDPSATVRDKVGDEYHYTGKYCSDCHEQIPVEGGNKFLKYGGDYNKLCKCHVEGPGSYIHPVDIVPSAEKEVRLPAELPLQEGKISCLTCHDIYWQCQKRSVDKISLRGAPYPKRSDFCYRCHDETSYMMLDPHVQLNAWGKIIVERCLYCHTEKPDEKRENYGDVRLIGNLEVICQRCHAIRGNHAGNFNHMVKPSAKLFARMQAMEKEFDIILPLDKDGEMTCITCHNPHDNGVIPAESPAAKGAGSKYRHRLPGRLCVECHKV